MASKQNAKRIITAAIGLATVFSMNAEGKKAGGFTLARDGKPAAAIVLDTEPTRSAQFAAAELQYHIGKITGAQLPIVNDAADAKGVRIFVGESEATRKMGLKNDDFEPQEYLVGFRKEGLVLMGRDADDRGIVDYADETTFPKNDHFTQSRSLLDEQGTCYAVYDFLEKFCGVRWYLPTELGLVYDPVGTLSVSGKDIRRKPCMQHRLIHRATAIPADLIGPWRGTQNVKMAAPAERLNRREAVLWTLRNRVGGRPHDMNHSFYGYYHRFLETNPEWFAQGYEGKPPQMCWTSTGLVAQVVQDARDYFDGKRSRGIVAQGDYFAVVPMDNWTDFCNCPECQSLINREPRRGSGAFTDVTSDYFWPFVNKIAREVGKTHPDKYIASAAYHGYAYPPTTEKMEPNVTITIAKHARRVFNSIRQQSDAAMLESWRREAPDVTRFVWIYFIGDSFPPFFASALVEQMKEYHRQGVRGFFVEPYYLADRTRSAIMDQLELYLILKLADDPELDGQVLINEFFERYYGSAAKPMKELYQGIEKVYCDDTIPYPDEGLRLQTEEVAWGILANEERMQEWGRLIAEAHRLAKTEVEKKRVELFDNAVWQYMVARRNEYLPTMALRDESLQSARVPRTESAAGDFAGVDWSSGVMLTNWLTMARGEGSDSGIEVEGRALHDGEFIYLQLAASFDPKEPEKKERSWNRDGWWIYFARQRAHPYLQLLVGQSGDIVARYHGGAGEPITEDYKVNLQVQTHNEPGRRIMEIAMSMTDLLPGGVKPGDTLYFNTIRANPQTRTSTGRERLAWIPTFIHGQETPSRFGEFILEE